MKITDLFPRRYATGLDLGGRSVIVTIAGLTQERMTPAPGIAPADKYVLHFRETPRGVVLSKILANQIAAALGDETDQWTGKRITLYPEVILVAGAERTVIRAKPADQERPIPAGALTVNQKEEAA